MSFECPPDEEFAAEVHNFTEQLHTLAAEEGVPEGAVTARGFMLGATLLEFMRQEHGDKPYHNHEHALNFTRYFWTLWKPLREQLPDRFDEAGFELGMIIGAGHDIINDPEAAKQNPGQNEQSSAELVRAMMLEAGYEEDVAERAYNGIIKTTVKRNDDGVIVQTFMREGSKDIIGLCAGQADMNGILLKGPTVLFKDAVALYHEYEPTGRALLNPAGVAKFLLDEEKYLNDRVDALSGDLEYYVDDETERELIKDIYWEQFRGASLNALAAVRRMHDSPEQTLKLVSDSVNATKNIAHQGLGRVRALQRHLTDQFRPGGDGQD